MSQSFRKDFISTDEDPGLRIESFAIIKLRGVTTKLNIIFFHHANFQGINLSLILLKINQDERKQESDSSTWPFSFGILDRIFAKPLGSIHSKSNKLEM